MNEKRFELLVSAVLLAFTVWYAVVMASYPSNAGRVPAIAAAVAAGALVVQLIIVSRTNDAPAATPSTETEASTGTPSLVDDDLVREGLDAGLTKEEAERVSAVESDSASYSTLLAVTGLRRRRLIIIAIFAIAFYLCILLIGFVVTTGVMIAAILAVSRERLQTVILGGVIGAAAAYVLVVLVLGLQPMQGYLVR